MPSFYFCHGFDQRIKVQIIRAFSVRCVTHLARLLARNSNTNLLKWPLSNGVTSWQRPNSKLRTNSNKQHIATTHTTGLRRTAAVQRKPLQTCSNLPQKTQTISSLCWCRRKREDVAPSVHCYTVVVWQNDVISLTNTYSFSMAFCYGLHWFGHDDDGLSEAWKLTNSFHIPERVRCDLVRLTWGNLFTAQQQKKHSTTTGNHTSPTTWWFVCNGKGKTFVKIKYKIDQSDL